MSELLTTAVEIARGQRQQQQYGKT